jgi:hypothetical protein
MTRMPTPLAQQEHEQAEIRRQAAALFVASLRDWAAHDGWYSVMRGVTSRYDTDQRARTVAAAEVDDFSSGYGWPSTFRALADAIELDEQAKRDAMDRR